MATPTFNTIPEMLEALGPNDAIELGGGPHGEVVAVLVAPAVWTRVLHRANRMVPPDTLPPPGAFPLAGRAVARPRTNGKPSYRARHQHKRRRPKL